MAGNRQSSLNDVISKGIHHQLSDSSGVAQFQQIHFLDSVTCTLQALFHHVGTELLDSQQTHFSSNAFTDSVDILVTADIQNVLDNIITVRILHEFKRLLNNSTNEVRPRLRGRGIEATLNDATTMAMASDIADAVGNSVKHKPGVSMSKLEENTLDDVVAVAINAQTHG